MGVKVAKFGGSSVADAIQIRKLRDIVKADDSIHYVVVSAPGKRFHFFPGQIRNAVKHAPDVPPESIVGKTFYALTPQKCKPFLCFLRFGQICLVQNKYHFLVDNHLLQVRITAGIGQSCVT